MKYIQLSLILLLVTGCAKTNEKEDKGLICKGNLTTYTEDTITYVAEEDIVSKMIIEKVINYQKMGYDNENISTFDASYKKQFEELEGLTYNSEIKDEDLIITITIDTKVADLTQLSSHGVIAIEETQELKSISVKKSQKYREKDGLICE